MSGGSRRAPRNRGKPSASDPGADEPLRSGSLSRRPGKGRGGGVGSKTFLGLFGIGFLALAAVSFWVYGHWWWQDGEDPVIRKLRRVVTPLAAPKMMDLPQFQGEHKESLYWGTYRPHVYLGIRARTPKSLIAGLMWLGIKNRQYHLRHVCQDSDELSSYGWTDHNGRDYGRQVLNDHGLIITTSFLKEKGEGSGYGGDWAVQLDVKNQMSRLDDDKDNNVHLFFYVADEEGNSLGTNDHEFELHDAALLAFGARSDIGGWQLHLRTVENPDIHFAGFRTSHMHNLTELVQGTIAFYARRTGQLKLPDTYEDSSNVIVFQISAKLPAKLDIAFISGTDLKNPRMKERVNNLRGVRLNAQLEKRQREFERKFVEHFGLKDKVSYEELAVGKAAIANMLGGIGYFYGQSKIALPNGFTALGCQYIHGYHWALSGPH